MITIIAGSRDGPNVRDVTEAVRLCGWAPSVVISGTAGGGDLAGERWAFLHGVPVVRMAAKWRLPGGMLDRGAGHKRNVEMAKRSDALIAIWDGKSPGTNHMIQTALARGLRVYVYRPRSARAAEAGPRVLNRHHGPMPAGAVYVGRGTPWGNPYKVGPDGSREEVIQKFRAFLARRPDLVASVRRELAGRSLVCSCAPAACHADVLLAVANSHGNQTVPNDFRGDEASVR